jgi:luciferase family oxidoreductase group 1
MHPTSSPSSSGRWRNCGRIDLGLGRAPGTDQLTLRALRRTPEAAENFPQDVLEVQAFPAPAGPNQRIRAVPAAGTEVPLWILGSSNFGAMLAAELGLPYAFASHFAPELLVPALQIYRSRFKPSEQLDRPYTMVGVNIIAASSDEAAMRQRVGWRRRSRCPLRISSAALAASASHRSTTLKATGRLRKKRRQWACSLAPSSARPIRFVLVSMRSLPKRAPTNS